jgi:hypothetical protein
MHHPNEPAAPEAPRRRFRKLRIAWSVAWGLLAVLLMGLWARSYTWEDGIGGTITNERVLQIWSVAGRVFFSTFAANKRPWTIVHLSREELLSMAKAQGLKLETRYCGFTEHGFLLPHCFMIALSVIFAALPWLTLRFSLRTMLIGTTLFALVLGTIVWITR